MGKSILILIIVAVGIVTQINCIIFQDDTSELKCVPNKSFTYDHNKCYCNEDGTEITCNREMYSTLTPELRSIQLQNITLVCVPNRHFKFFNQDCICHISGKFASCIRSQGPNLDSRENCLPGVIFDDNCNGCICGPDGKAACTNLNCDIIGQESEDVQCVPESDLVFECNDCICDASGTSMACNKMGCGSMTLFHEHILNVTMNCQANSVFDYNCHQCICNKNGNYAMCSGKECPNQFDFKKVKDTVEKCNPGMIFASDCNICVCGKNGKGVCTTFSCDTTYKFNYE